MIEKNISFNLPNSNIFRHNNKLIDNFKVKFTSLAWGGQVNAE